MERYEITLSKIREMIGGGQLRPGGRMPPERDLATSLGVGRRALRRALEVLEREGQVTRRQGRGTFLTAPETGAEGPFNGVLQHTNPFEVMEVRLTVEPMIARLASLRLALDDTDLVVSDGFLGLFSTRIHVRCAGASSVAPASGVPCSASDSSVWQPSAGGYSSACANLRVTIDGSRFLLT